MKDECEELIEKNPRLQQTKKRIRYYATSPFAKHLSEDYMLYHEKEIPEDLLMLLDRKNVRKY